ncbi:MAG: cytochrome c oxidase subunit 3 [Halioglobus sp.]
MIHPLQTLRQKPWLSQTSETMAFIPEVNSVAAARIALRFILAIIGVLFFLFVITYLARSQYPDFQPLAGAPWQPFSDTSRLWLNTSVLALASLAMQAGIWSTRKEQQNRTAIFISVAVFFTLLFLLAQLQLWQQLSQLGFYVNSNPANSYFYLLTAVHGLHLVGGLIVLGYLVMKTWQQNSVAVIGEPLRLCAIYWHFLLCVWLVLFALLASSPATINALAAMCGF